jgi:predicted AAA+ superfamily ATPase
MIEIQNPWWIDDKWYKKDKHIKEWSNQEIKWFPKWIESINLNAFSLNFVYGPRQVGKTTGIKLLIKNLIEKGYDPKKITYLNLDFIRENNFLNILLNIIKEKEKGIIVLDEFSNLSKDAYRKLKGLIDQGYLENFSLILLGSCSLELLKIKESFIGRRGKGKDVEVLPLSFKEYFEIFKPKSEIRILKLFDKYLENGGFPRIINNDLQFFYEFIGEIKRDVEKINKNYKTFFSVIYNLLRIGVNRFDFSKLASEIGLSRPTTEDYIKIIENLFIGKIIYWKDINKNVINFRKEKKIMFRDPGIVKAFSLYFDYLIDKSFILEWVVQEHVFRENKEINYYYTENYEIDVVSKDLKLEIKTNKKVKRKDVLSLSKEEIPFFLLKV